MHRTSVCNDATAHAPGVSAVAGQGPGEKDEDDDADDVGVSAPEEVGGVSRLLSARLSKSVSVKES
jgi:hypothetical protein